MSPAGARRLARLVRLRDRTRRSADRLLAAHGAAIEDYRAEVGAAVQLATGRLRATVAEISDDPTCGELAQQIAEYVDWLQWTLWDLPYFAVAVRPDRERFRARLAAGALVYLSARVFDDVIDRHFWYKARRPTLLSVVAEKHLARDGAEGMTVLAGILLLCEGLRHTAAEAARDGRPDGFEQVLGSFQRTVVGAILEHSPRGTWTPELYERLIQLKNVDYWRVLYSALDPDRGSPLYPFLERYYALAQKMNDVEDFPEDERRGQPNLVSLTLPDAAEEILADDFLDLGTMCRALPALERQIAELKLGECLDRMTRLGLFAAEPPEPPAPGAPDLRALGLHAGSDLAAVVERAGAAALEQLDCAVCGSSERRRLFAKQGFAYHRCAGCSHIYVSPGLRRAAWLELEEEPADGAGCNPYLEAQRLYAEPICRLLLLRSPGARLLDLGFGEGHLLRTARALGFEVYGMDASRRAVERLEPEFGRHVVCGAAGADPIPWSDLDVIVMSHVLEHLRDPAAVLAEVHSRLKPGGLLYVAVPDMGSVQLHVLGKHWEAVSPLVHPQGFNEASLGHLLARCGFAASERVEVPLPPWVRPLRWMRLMRDLGGDESGELAVLAERPEMPEIAGAS